MNDTDILIQYFQLYIEEITKGKDNYFISFCNVDIEIFEKLKYDTKFFGDSISLEFINQDEYDKAVRLRNDINKRKIVILTSKSVKNIDSLKHFSEFEVFPDRENIELLWKILKKLFSIETGEKIYQRFFQTIIKQRKVTMSQLISYIMVSRDATGHLKNSLLNSNLNMLGCWKAGSTSQLVQIATLHKIIRASDPSQIRKKLENITQEKVKGLNVRAKKDIERLIFENNFQKLLEDYEFTQVQDYFQIRKKSSNSHEQNEVVHQILYSFQDYKSSEESFPSLEEFEKDLLESVEYFESTTYSRLSETLNKFQRQNIRKKDFILRINEIKKVILNNTINLKSKDKEQFLKLLKELCSEFKFFDEVNDNIAYPYAIEHYVKLAYPFAEKYFDLLKFILSNKMIQLTLNQLELFDKVIELFLIETDSGYIMPFFHPIYITYFCKILKTYKKMNQLLNEKDEILESVLESTLHGIMDKFPISTLMLNNIRYQFDNSTMDFPFFIKFVPPSYTLSKSSVEPNLLYKKIENYIISHPYISELRVLTIGHFDLSTIGSLNNKIKAFSQLGKVLLKEVVISLASENVDRIRSQIDFLFEDERFLDCIKFKVLSVTESSKKDFHKMVDNNHIIFILDSQLLYAQPKLLEITSQKNTLEIRLKQQNLNGYIEHFVDDDINDINLLWDTLQNISKNNNSVPARWNYGELNAKTFGDIINEIEQSRELNIVAFSSNLDIVSHIFIQRNMYEAMLVGSKNRSMFQITFLSSKKEKLEAIQHYLYPECFISIEDLLGLTLKDPEDLSALLGLSHGIDLIDFYLRFSLQKQKIQIEAIIPESHKDKIIEEEFLGGIGRILGIIYQKNQNIFTDSLKKSFANYMYSSSRSYADSFFALYLSNSYFVSQQYIDVNLCYKYFSKQVTQFDFYNAKQVCEFINQTNIYDEATIFDFRSRFEDENVNIILEGAHELMGIYNNYEDKVKKLIKGVHENA